MDGIIGRIIGVVTNMFIRRGVRSAIDRTMGTGKTARSGDRTADRETRDAEREARRLAKQARQASKLTRKF